MKPVPKEKVMIRKRSQKFLFVCALAASLFLIPSANAQSESSSATQQTAIASTDAPVYDMSKEIKVQGTIQQIEMLGPGGPLGTHVLIQTPQGVVDAHLGYRKATTAENLGLTVGQEIQITGMMANIGSNSVLLARILTTPTHIFILRSEHGIPVRMLPKGSSAAANTSKGGL
jgi:hypothetical protein